jgi:hypothetical protein
MVVGQKLELEKQEQGKDSGKNKSFDSTRLPVFGPGCGFQQVRS